MVTLSRNHTRPLTFENGCGGGSCAKPWPIKMCAHSRTCENGDGSRTNPQPKRCVSDADCGTSPTSKCLAPLHALGKPLPSNVLGLNCTNDDECEATVDGVRALGRCSATWSLCREMFDMDRTSEKDANRAGFLVKLDYDWIDAASSFLGAGGSPKITSDLGSKDPAPFATYGWKATGESKAAHSVWMTHVISMVDLPFRDVDNPLVTGANVFPRDVVGDHIQPAPSLQDAQRSENKLATGATAATMSQAIFSTFPCFSGSENAPPDFYTSTISSSATRLTNTDIECRRDRACYVDLHIIDYRMKADGTLDRLASSVTTDRVAIEMALGTPASSQGQLYDLSSETLSRCEGIGKLSCRFRLENEFWLKDEGVFSTDAVGLTLAKCFVAVDKHDESTCNAATKTKCTCRSLPMCVKFKIVGSAPVFVAPTPLQMNSRDDNGVLVPGRTDVTACEGYKLSLPLVAKDDDAGDKALP